MPESVWDRFPAARGKNPGVGSHCRCFGPEGRSPVDDLRVIDRELEAYGSGFVGTSANHRRQ